MSACLYFSLLLSLPQVARVSARPPIWANVHTHTHYARQPIARRLLALWLRCSPYLNDCGSSENEPRVLLKKPPANVDSLGARDRVFTNSAAPPYYIVVQAMCSLERERETRMKYKRVMHYAHLRERERDQRDLH